MLNQKQLLWLKPEGVLKAVTKLLGQYYWLEPGLSSVRDQKSSWNLRNFMTYVSDTLDIELYSSTEQTKRPFVSK